MIPEPGIFEVRDKDLAGRIARLSTPHGWLETPALLPVIDIARQEVQLDEIAKLGYKAVITNAYLLWRRMRGIALEKGVHKVLGFDGIVMTDSGAYQMLEYGEVHIAPEEVIEFQKAIGSDIAVILDVPTGNQRSRSQAEHSVVETLRRAREAVQQIDPEKRIWTLPLQGGPFRDLLQRSAEEARSLLGPYRLVALGSPTVLLERYDYETLMDMIYVARSTLPWSIPMHLFGAGHPMIIPFAVALGVDMFDSASYILYARDDRYMTETRTYRLRDLDYLPCSCPVCSRYTVEELKEMPKMERTRLLALHNLYVLRRVINETKQAIREGRLWELLEERSRGHPSLARALRRLARYREYLAKHAPRLKAAITRGIFLVSPESVNHPKLAQHQWMLLHRYRPPRTGAVLVPVLEDEKPLTSSRLARIYRDKVHVVGYSLYIGAIPLELSETYPLSQYELNTTPYKEVVESTSERIVEYITSHGYEEVEVVACSDIEWSRELARHVVAKLNEKKIEARYTEKQCKT